MPLVKKDGLPDVAQRIIDQLKYDFNVVYDEKDRPSDLGRNGCAELAEQYAEFIESELWRQIDAQSHDVA